MATEHSATVRLAQVEASRKGWRLFTNPVGSGWVGKLRRDWTDSRMGHVVQVAAARLVRFGLALGSFDLVGWRPVVITPDMVGKTLAQFATVDAKTAGYRRLSPEQVLWARNVKAAGGFAGVAMKVGNYTTISEIGGDA